MNKSFVVLKSSFFKITNTIAFYPSIIALGGIAVFILVSFIEHLSWINSLKEDLPWLFIRGRGEATIVVSTLAGSVISLMVFSFSMVMVVLNRASSALSPRVLPGLISDKSHQIVLGVYLSTIIYNLLMLVNFGPEEVPSFGVLISLIFGVTCMALFVFFIHSISSSIKVENIIQRIYLSTLDSMNFQMLDEAQEEIDMEEEGWWTYYTFKSGYLKEVRQVQLLELMQKHNIKIRMLEPIGIFMIKDHPYFEVHCEGQPKEELIKEIRSNIYFYTEDHVYDHYRYGFTQLSEIALKALSPGINDPGTGLKCLDLLSILFIKKMEKLDRVYYRDKEGEPRLFMKPVSLDYLMLTNFLPIRHFGKGDLLITLKLVSVLKDLLYVDRKSQHYTKAIVAVLKSCIQSADDGLDNTLDRKYYNESLAKIRDQFHISLELLPTKKGHVSNGEQQ